MGFSMFSAMKTWSDGNWGPTKYSHTFWIDENGKVINIPTGGPTHYSWIAQHFNELFPDEEFSDAAIFDTPTRRGWVHVRNHFSTVSISGKPEAIRRRRNLLMDVVEDRLGLAAEGLNDFAVDLTYYGETMDDIKRGPFLRMPEELDQLRDILGNPGMSSVSAESPSAKKQAWIQRHRPVLKWMDDNKHWSDFANSLIDFYKNRGFLTERQCKAVAKIAYKQQQRGY